MADQVPGNPDEFPAEILTREQVIRLELTMGLISAQSGVAVDDQNRDKLDRAGIEAMVPSLAQMVITGEATALGG